MTLYDFFYKLLIIGLMLVASVYFPIQIHHIWRRHQQRQLRLRCRLCGYRFLKSDSEGICPRCQARNK